MRPCSSPVLPCRLQRCCSQSPTARRYTHPARQASRPERLSRPWTPCPDARVAFASSCRSTSWHSSLDDTRMEPISTTENLKIGVSVQLPNPSGFVGQKSGPETNLRAAMAEGNEKQVFSVRCNDKEKCRLVV